MSFFLALVAGHLHYIYEEIGPAAGQKSVGNGIDYTIAIVLYVAAKLAATGISILLDRFSKIIVFRLWKAAGSSASFITPESDCFFLHSINAGNNHHHP